MLFNVLRVWLRDGLWVLLVKGENFVHQITKLIGLEAELFSHLLGLGLLASEVVPDEAHFKGKVLGHLGTLLRCTGRVVKLDDLLEGVTQLVVVGGLCREIRITLLQGDLLGCGTALGWRTLGSTLSCCGNWSICLPCEELLQIGWVIGD